MPTAVVLSTLMLLEFYLRDAVGPDHGPDYPAMRPVASLGALSVTLRSM
jgi:hypothetical protein